MAAQNSGAKSLKEYLKKYDSNHDEEKTKKTKKKVKKAKPDGPGGFLVVDEDPAWQKPIKLDEEEDNDSPDEERPQIDEDIDVKRMKRLEQLRLQRGYNVIAEDGSGWVSLSSTADRADAQNYDISPTRRHRSRNDTPEPNTSLAYPDDPDLSPSRKSRIRNDTPSPSALMKDAALSPPRRRKARNDTPSPSPLTRGSDLSPPRKNKFRNDTPSPSRPRKDVDLSPSRKKKARNDTPSPSPPRKDVDLSPPRKKKARNDTPRPSLSMKDADLLPSRKKNVRNDTRALEHAADSDMSPPRRSHTQKPEPFEGRKFEALDAVTSLGSDLSPPRKKERPRTGLVTGQDIREEISNTRKNDLMRFQQLDPSISGRGAEPIYRDKKGQRISKDEYLKSKQKLEEKPKEKKLEWGKGLAQKREAEIRLQELELEKDKPFARTRDDPELDKMLKERVRWGDPMAHLVKKKHVELFLADLGDNEKMKESGFIVPQEIPNHSWIRRGLDAAPNRYGIKPGRHWDGVDRSNGFEKKMFQRLNEKRATEREAYLWSVSDM